MRHPWYEARRFSTIRDMVDTMAESRADAIAIEFRSGDGVVRKTWREFRDDVARLAAALGERGLAGAHVAVIGGNSYEWILASIAAVCGGAVAVPINHTLPRGIMLKQIAHSDAAAIVYDKDFAPVAEDAGPTLRIAMNDVPALAEEGGRLVREGRRGLMECAPKPEDAAFIIYSSGTTGLEGKAIALDHGLVMRSAYAHARSISLGPKNLSTPPLFYAAGILLGVIIPMAQGTTVAVNRSLLEIYADLQLFQPTSSIMVPMVVSGVLKKTAGMSGEEMRRFFGGKLETILTGGAPTSPELLRRLATNGICPVILYGLTETNTTVVCLQNLREDKPGSVGMPLAGVRIRIDNPDAEGNGEVLVHEEFAMKKYYKNPAATREALRGGWFHTGDIGRLDDDGHLYITGRLKNLIILSNGENISPEELEGPLGQRKYVAECLVHEDGGMIAATIYPGEEYLDETKLSREELTKRLYAEIDALNAEFSASRRIGKIIVSDKPLPKVGAGKIRRR